MDEHHGGRPTILELARWSIAISSATLFLLLIARGRLQNSSYLYTHERDASA